MFHSHRTLKPSHTAYFLQAYKVLSILEKKKEKEIYTFHHSSRFLKACIFKRPQYLHEVENPHNFCSTCIEHNLSKVGTCPTPHCGTSLQGKFPVPPTATGSKQVPPVHVPKIREPTRCSSRNEEESMQCPLSVDRRECGQHQCVLLLALWHGVPCRATSGCRLCCCCLCWCCCYCCQTIHTWSQRNNSASISLTELGMNNYGW